MEKRIGRRLGLIAAVVLAAACGDGANGPSAGPLRGGVLATFAVGSERFSVWIRNEEAVRQVLALQRGASTATIPNGALRTGPGQGNHNGPYSWHLDPDEIELSAFTIELCDGVPSYIEANRDQFISEVGRYCPWGARLVSLQDHR